MVEPLKTAGTHPLTARTEPWMDRLVRNPALCSQLIETYGSPINVHDFGPLRTHVEELQQVAQQHDVRFGVYFARKANKTFGAAQAAYAAGAGIDVASRRELEQCLALGIPGNKLILSAATKTPATIDAALNAFAVISVDNEDEFRLVLERAAKTESEAHIALRLGILEQDLLASMPEGSGSFGTGGAGGTGGTGPDVPHIPPTRFGLGIEQWLELVGTSRDRQRIKVRGVHFHLNGYSAAERAVGITCAISLIDQLKSLGHEPEFIDMGGGIPMNYLTSPTQWNEFWQAIGGRSDSLETWRGDTLGLVDPSAARPSPATYPYYQDITRGQWLAQVLSAPSGTSALTGASKPGGPAAQGAQNAHGSQSGPPHTIASELRRRNLELRCEPGRSLMDGCGMTIAQVAARQKTSDGIDLVVLYMNRTQMRSTSADFLVDPIHMRVPAAQQAGKSAAPDAPTPVAHAYLMGSYCIEEELIMRRSFKFPDGVRVGDLIAFPNTGGYLMHILESASHQIPLAANLIHTPHEEPTPGNDPQTEVSHPQWTQDPVDHVSPAGGEPLHAC